MSEMETTKRCSSGVDSTVYEWFRLIICTIRNSNDNRISSRMGRYLV